jgi:hypothetical protein
LEEYRRQTLAEEGGVLGVLATSVTLDPDLTDRDAARSVISARLYDDEKLSGAYGSQYVWVPKWSDQRRTLQRGYRVRYASIFSPPPDGAYRLQFYGYGQTREIPHATSARAVENEVKRIDPDLTGVEVEEDPLGLLLHLPFRVGMGATAGRLVAQGGVGICLVNRDFTQPLTKGTRILLSPRMPFESEDEVLGLHDCINLALADIREADLLPVASPYPASQRPSVVRLHELAPWLEPEMVIGFYAPTDWVSVTCFRPPVSGTYQLQPVTALQWQPTPTPLEYNATGAELELALASVATRGRVRVEPQGASPQYDLIWQTMYHEATFVASAGAIVGYSSERLHDPYRTAIPPSFLGDFEADTFSDPGYGPDQSWFVGCRRPASTRICPQVYPTRADGSPDYSRDPGPGSYWVNSVSGLVHDFDQARPPVAVVAPAALRYACLALANVAPAGEAARWETLAQRQAMVAGARVVYGKQHHRRTTTLPRAWPPLGEKAWGFFQP